MPTWLTALLALLRSAFALRKAKNAGQAEQRAEDAQAAAAKQAEVSDAIRQVDSTTTHSDADVDRRLHDGSF